MIKSIEKVAASLTKWVIPFCLLTVVPLVSCEEDDDDDLYEGEYDNWQQRNDEELAEWVSDTSLKKIKNHALHEDAPTVNSDYIYVKVLESGDPDTPSPFLTDTVRIAYRGRILPTVTYPEGRVFDQSYLNEFSWRTAYPAQFPSRSTQDSPLIDGIETAEIDHGEVVDKKYYTVDGVLLQSPVRGVNIVRMTHVDGTVTTKKIVVK